LVPHLSGPRHCDAPSVLCSAKTAAAPSRVASHHARFPVPCLLHLFARRPEEAPWTTPGPLLCRWTLFRHSARRTAALPSSRVTLVDTCPALRPRWCLGAHLSAPVTAAFRADARRRLSHARGVVILLTTTFNVSGLHHTACILATPGSAPPVTRTHAGSLPACRLGFDRAGIEFHLAPAE